MRKILIPASIVALAMLGGCGSQKPSTPDTPPPTTPAASTTTAAPASSFKVALLTSGPVTDGGWNESASAGLLKIQKDLGATVDKQENLKDSQFVDAFRDFANRGYNLIIGHGDEYGPAAAKVAAEYP